ncbi:MAG: helix-turn-helix transcriptional regulator [Oscillospiraceae bacterium]|nr:helix-turn-helix transcriptional regulator [Oscillospiraceae bacterium]
MIRRHLNIFWQTLAAHLAVVAVLALALIPVIRQVDRAFREQEAEHRRAVMASGLDMITSQLNSLQNSLTSNISGYFSEASMIEGVPAAKNVVTINKTREQLAYIAGGNSLVADIAVCFFRNSLVVTAKQSFLSTESFLEAYTFTDMSPETLLSYYEADPFSLSMRFHACGSIRSRGQIQPQKTAFCYAIPLSTFSDATLSPPRGVAFVFIRQEPVLELLQAGTLQEYGSLDLADRDGSALMSYSARSGSLPAEDDVVLSMTSPAGTLCVSVRIPKAYFDDVTGPIYSRLIQSLLAVILVVLLTTFWASYRQSQPMRRLLAELTEKGLLKSSSQDEYAKILTLLENLKLERDDTSRMLDSYREASRANLLDRLFHSSGLTEEQAVEIRETFPTFPEHFLVCYGQIRVAADEDASGGVEVVRLLAANLLRSRLPEGALLHLLEDGAFGLVWPCPGGRKEGEKALSELVREDSALQVTVLLAVGGFCGRLDEVREAFIKARSSYLHFCTQEMPPPQSEVLPAELGGPGAKRPWMRELQDFYTRLLAGEAERAAEIANAFIWESGTLGIDSEQRYFMLRGILMLAWQEAAPEEPPLELPKYQLYGSPEKCLTALQEACRQAAEAASAQQMSQKDSQGEAFLCYLSEHYADPDCCAGTMASAFGLSEKYLFSLFKERTGYSPASYLQQVRMAKAAELLKTTSLTAQEISTQVGFLSFSTFHKAFKREYGMTPGQYRASHHNQT